MFPLDKTQLNIDFVFDSCVNSIKDISEKNKLSKLKAYIRGCSKVYHLHAQFSLLYQLIDEYNYHGSKDDLVRLYEQRMVKNKAGRKIYDQLLNSTPSGICPFCGFGHVSTLDHYMPKKKYPSFSIIPINLVPACSDCNHGKSETVALTKNEQVLHPYYDFRLLSVQWLFAKVNETSPVSVSFFICCPPNFNNIDRDRIFAHFNGFDLAKRFSVQAANELSILRNLHNITKGNGIKDELYNLYLASSMQNVNSWKTALYFALFKSNWYCSGGYNN